MTNWVEHVGEYLKHKEELHIHVVFYERLLRLFDTELSQLLEYLGIELDRKAIGCIKQGVEFSTMRSKNPYHVRRGESAQWVKLLTNEQKRQAARSAGPMLQCLNYPVREEQTDSALPHVPAQLNRAMIEKAIVHANRRTLMNKVKSIYGILANQQPKGY